MPLIKSKSKKAVKKNIESEMEAGKPQEQSIAIALNMQRRAKRKMADGGLVDPDAKKTVGQIIGYPGSNPIKKAHGGMIDEEKDAHEEQRGRMEQELQENQDYNDKVDEESDDSQEQASLHRYANGGMVDPDRAMTIAQAIRSKKMEAIHPEDPLDQLEPIYDDLNEEAASNPEEINPSEGEESYDRQNRIAAIRRKRMRG